MKIIYEAFFVDNPSELERDFPIVHPNRFYHHATIAFKPEALTMCYPVGMDIELIAIGRLTTEKVDALLMAGSCGSNKFPHITLSTAHGVKPSQSNIEFDNYSENTIFFEKPKAISAKYGYFDGNGVCVESLAEWLEEAHYPDEKIPEIWTV